MGGEARIAAVPKQRAQVLVVRHGWLLRISRERTCFICHQQPPACTHACLCTAGQHRNPGAQAHRRPTSRLTADVAMMPHTEQMRDSGATSPPLLLPSPAPLPAALLPAAQSRLEWRECRPRAVERVAGLAERLPGARGELQETGVPGWEAEPGSKPCARSKRRVCFTPWGVSGRGQQVVSCQRKKGKALR